MATTFIQKLKNAWAVWKRIAHVIGNFQARVILTILYAIAVLPFGVLVRLLADPLRLKHRPTQWIEHPPEVYDMGWVHKQ
jgi:hypothetical protein